MLLFSGDYAYTCFQCAGHANFSSSPDHSFLKLIAVNVMPKSKHLTSDIYHLCIFDMNAVYTRNCIGTTFYGNLGT
jgi:hypothetical protein